MRPPSTVPVVSANFRILVAPMARAMTVLGLVAATCAAGCDSPPPLGPDEIRLRVSLRCPGDPQCPDGPGRVLEAGAGKRDVTPVVETFTDENGNKKWDPGEPFVDANGNGALDLYYLAGLANNRYATGVHDPIWARAIALRQNQTTIAIVAVDCVGLFHDELEEVRKRLDPSLGVDYVIMTALHDHNAPDTIGGWGEDEFKNGINQPWRETLRDGMVAAIADAVRALQPAVLTAGSILVEDPGRDVEPYVSDTRDPVVIDNRLHALRFDTPDGKPIVTLVNWASHPESVGDDNRLISSDYVHWVREEVEKGGGEVVAVQGALGGQIGPRLIRPVASDGKRFERRAFGFDFGEAWGRSIGRFAVAALDPARGASVITDPSPRLRVSATKLDVHVDSLRFQLAGRLGVFAREQGGTDKYPTIPTELAYVHLGDQVSFVTIPGELLPELWLGGYDGSAAFNYPFIDTARPNAPDPTLAPKPPYLRELLQGAPEHRMLFGVAQDFVGYIIPPYNFVLASEEEGVPYLNEAAGDHYEETNSLGPRAAAEIVGTARQLVEADGPGR